MAANAFFDFFFAFTQTSFSTSQELQIDELNGLGISGD